MPWLKSHTLSRSEYLYLVECLTAGIWLPEGLQSLIVMHRLGQHYRQTPACFVNGHLFGLTAGSTRQLSLVTAGYDGSYLVWDPQRRRLGNKGRLDAY